MKFVEKCFLFDDDIFRIRDEERCAAVSFQSIKKHLYQGHIHFSLLIKHNGMESSVMVDACKKVGDGAQATVAKTTPFSFANKGVIKSNNARKSQSIPMGSSSSVSVASVQANSTNSSTNSQPSQPSISTEKAPKSQPPDYSSINRIDEDKTPFYGNPFHRSNSNDEVSKSTIFIRISKFL